MPASWCAARVAEVRAHVNDVDAPTASRQQYRTWLIQLLSQIDNPPAPAVAPEAQGLGAGRLLPAKELDAACADILARLSIYQRPSYFALRGHIDAQAARLATLEAAGAGEAGRNWVADGLPPTEDADGVSAYVLVWSEPHEMPQVRYYDHGGEHWAGGNGTWESTRRFEQWAPIPAATPVAPAPEQPAEEGGAGV